MLVDESPHLVQLGTLNLAVEAGPSKKATQRWLVLDLETLHSFQLSESCREQVEALNNLIANPGINLHLVYSHGGDEVIIRVSVLPSDAPGSTWKRPGDRNGKRRSQLPKLFHNLKDGWNGGGEWLHARTAEDKQRINELYAEIPSPPDPFFDDSSITCASDREAYYRLMELDEPRGIKTIMYKYQFMETAPKALVDPIFTPLNESGREGKYFINFINWDIQRHPSQYELPRGGILCEQMGVGKTLMCLALITATLHQPVRPPRVTLDDVSPLTSHTLNTYPFKRYVEAREALGVDLAMPRLPTLVDLCSNILIANDHSALRAEYAPTTLVSRLKEPTFFYETPLEEDCVRGAKRKYLSSFTRTTELVHTTLVVVPRILMGQWKDEIKKHITEGTLSVLIVTSKILPTIDEMRKHDVVLIDVNRFGQEESIRRARLEMEPSEFLKARWKRIILDEGHVAGDSSPTNAMRLAMAMSVERRWVVSGTPSKILQQGGEAELASTLPHVPPEASDDLEWSPRELNDVARLGSMMGGFLAVEPFASEKVFSERVTSAIRGRNGPKLGAIWRLKYLMSELMVKHEPRIIDAEARLPDSKLTIELLRFDPMQKITYNVLAALVASNVYLTNFEDQDYFLHPKNVKSLNTVVRNLHLATFWYSARHMGVAKSLERTQFQLENNQNLSEQARNALKEVVAHFEIALSHPGWTEWMEHAVSAAYNVYADVPLAVREDWSDSTSFNPNLIAADSLKALRNLNRPGVSMTRLQIAGESHRAHKAVAAQAEDEQDDKPAKSKKPTSSSKKGAAHAPRDEATQSAAHGPTAVPKEIMSKRKSPKKSNVDDNLLLLQLEEAEMNADRDANLDDLPMPMPPVIRTQSRSTKLNFVINEVLKSPTDKFVIFGDVYELAHLTEALDLVDVESCFVGTAVSVVGREEALRKFQEPAVRVCLLDLKVGARGLNLVAANRLILLAPVWSLDIQAQAIKRIHRIGQTRGTWVQILVMQGTFEEEIAKRSSSIRTEKDEKIYSRAMIENPRFVYLDHEGDISFPVRFTPDVQTQAGGQGRARATSPDVITPDSALPITPVGRRLDTVRLSTSPSPRNASGKHAPPILKRKAGGSEGDNGGKKKSRVAFV
ncbi:SNF2 family N-terminal domain-domain-containing protein [Kockovaella imperatae]|uniref:SNF2 family N-terminal domain-domain-containing protein n=1 Tax=Kockovaella imperatae TaxID=4999 RepID=A0A1Y1UK53_9TREE|nr:SNF2 family N-terminal domain-domain-containing protein [Kockovaella imperatae]ORX38379.1 SNF2 family N-terminal domain-domain-containing protein [Kockovaella imperatae]